MVELTDLAPYTYLIVGIIAAAMAYLGWRSYQNTANVRVLFVVIAFVAIALKSLFVVLHEWASHKLDHHEVIVIMGLFDVLIVLLFFVPFLTPRTPRNG